MRNLLRVINHALRSLSSGFWPQGEEEQGEKNTATKHWPTAVLMAGGCTLQISVMKIWRKKGTLLGVSLSPSTARHELHRYQLDVYRRVKEQTSAVSLVWEDNLRRHLCFYL